MPPTRSTRVCDALADDLDALSASVEDADAGSAAEQPVFDEPGVAATATGAAPRVSALFADEAAATAAAAALSATRGGDDVRIVAIAAVADQDWVRLTQAQFGPSEIAPGFWIVPTWSEVPAKRASGDPSRSRPRLRHRHAIRRRGCACAGSPRNGSAAGVAWRARSTTAAARACSRSRRADSAPPTSMRSTSTRPRSRRPRRTRAPTASRCAPACRTSVAGPYQLVVANILAAPLKLLAPLLAALVDEGGALVLSGILARQADELIAAYAPWIELAVADEDDGWILMVGRRRGAERMA